MTTTGKTEVRWLDYDPPWAAEACDWCGARSKEFHRFDRAVVCWQCAMKWHHVDWFCFCDECYVATCVTCKHPIICCATPADLGDAPFCSGCDEGPREGKVSP